MDTPVLLSRSRFQLFSVRCPRHVTPKRGLTGEAGRPVSCRPSLASGQGALHILFYGSERIVESVTGEARSVKACPLTRSLPPAELRMNIRKALRDCQTKVPRGQGKRILKPCPNRIHDTRSFARQGFASGATHFRGCPDGSASLEQPPAEHIRCHLRSVVLAGISAFCGARIFSLRDHDRTVSALPGYPGARRLPFPGRHRRFVYALRKGIMHSQPTWKSTCACPGRILAVISVDLPVYMQVNACICFI